MRDEKYLGFSPPPPSRLKIYVPPAPPPHSFRLTEICSTWLLAGQTQQGLRVLAAALGAPGSPVKRVKFPDTLYEEGGACTFLDNSVVVCYLNLLLQEEPQTPGGLQVEVHGDK